ncbi:AraC family transcriptional regulator [Flavobacterium sp. FlaQc-51]|uniref:AraC family transcriptional regulator n=1 Tax=Flavobacterium sp. FlaQc-51 TaxID=3374184 RepID=UPI00375812EF
MKKSPIILKHDHDGSGIRIEPIDDLILNEPSDFHEPHRHEHYICILVEKGFIENSVDFRKTIIRKNSLFVSYPGQVHQLLKSTSVTGWVLAIDNKLVDDNVSSILQQLLSEVINLELGSGESKWFKNILGLIAGTDSKELGMVINSQAQVTLATAFMQQVAFVYQGREQRFTLHHSANSIYITKKFKQVLKQQFRALKRPGDYAEILNISVSHLNDTVKAVTGFSLTYHIQQEVLREAQRLLFHSHFSVKEIAVLLGYEDYKYFNRLFSKVTGISPGAFRKQEISMET